uniref:NADH dehydrogenase subunit 6 n=1 Tax=Osmia rufa TaxID=1437190 RepID=A0A0S2LTB8_OSMRU|nr:NADH dehydrogenase subunit 6 [Osmia bicornis]
MKILNLNYILLMLISKILFMFMNLFIITNVLLLSSLHPITILFHFIMFTLSSSMLIFLNLNNSLYSFMITISLIGGMMIMFNYFISLINNENSKMKFFELITSINFFFISFIMIIYFMYQMPIFFFTENMILNKWSLKIQNIYFYPMNYLTIMMILFLLICLTLSFKMSTIKMTPLRKIKI